MTRSETLPAADFESAAATESTALRTVAALYVDPRGPYPSMPGVDCWDERRDARNYAGPHPVVAHPPCGPWSRLRFFCRHQARELAPLAVAQVRRWLGVLEHPMGSLLWREMALPLPGGASRRIRRIHRRSRPGALGSPRAKADLALHRRLQTVRHQAAQRRGCYACRDHVTPLGRNGSSGVHPIGA